MHGIIRSDLKPIGFYLKCRTNCRPRYAILSHMRREINLFVVADLPINYRYTTLGGLYVICFLLTPDLPALVTAMFKVKVSILLRTI